MEGENVFNVNYPTEKEDIIRNYQLIRNDIIETDDNRHIVCFSLMINSVVNNRVVKSEYLCDVTRDEAQARMMFDVISLGDVPQELLNEIVQEMLG